MNRTWNIIQSINQSDFFYLILVHPNVSDSQRVLEEGVTPGWITVRSTFPENVPHPGAGNDFQPTPTHPNLLKIKVLKTQVGILTKRMTVKGLQI